MRWGMGRGEIRKEASGQAVRTLALSVSWEADGGLQADGIYLPELLG